MIRGNDKDAGSQPNPLVLSYATPRMGRPLSRLRHPRSPTARIVRFGSSAQDIHKIYKNSRTPTAW
jgi:hypothetical protein